MPETHKKAPNFWRLAGATYGLVIAVTILAIWSYYRYRPASVPEEGRDNIAVGAVWIPSYPGALMHDQSSAMEGNLERGSAVFQSGDPPEKVLAFYRRTFKKAGFEFPVISRIGDVQTIQVLKKNGKMTASVSIMSTANGSEARIATTAKKD